MVRFFDNTFGFGNGCEFGITNINYVNHDTLANLDEANQKKLMLAFIANQVPAKLDQEDRELLQNNQKKLQGKSLQYRIPLTFLFTAFFSFGRFQLGSTLNPRRAQFFLLNFVKISVIDYLVKTNVNHVISLNDLANNKIYSDLANKYNFNIYDFHQAKRESYLYRLSDLLGGQVPGLWQ